MNAQFTLSQQSTRPLGTAVHWARGCAAWSKLHTPSVACDFPNSHREPYCIHAAKYRPWPPMPPPSEPHPLTAGPQADAAVPQLLSAQCLPKASLNLRTASRMFSRDLRARAHVVGWLVGWGVPKLLCCAPPSFLWGPYPHLRLHVVGGTARPCLSMLNPPSHSCPRPHDPTLLLPHSTYLARTNPPPSPCRQYFQKGYELLARPSAATHPNADARTKPSPAGPKPEPGVVTMLHFCRISANTSLRQGDGGGGGEGGEE